MIIKKSFKKINKNYVIEDETVYEYFETPYMPIYRAKWIRCLACNL